MRQSLGAAVFAGMLGVTLSGLILTPIFHVFSRGVIASDGPFSGVGRRLASEHKRLNRVHNPV